MGFLDCYSKSKKEEGFSYLGQVRSNRPHGKSAIKNILTVGRGCCKFNQVNLRNENLLC